VAVELREIFMKGLIVGFSGSFCYVKETAVDGMFSLQISHIQKFAWPFFRHIILSDKVRCSHIKELRRAKKSMFFKLWIFSFIPKKNISNTVCKFAE
jgi:hypothetical protein